MFLMPTTTYGSLVPGSEFIRWLVRQGKMSPEAAKAIELDAELAEAHASLGRTIPW